jgi:transcriptional regulator with XRE-family HTH domain
LTESSLIEYGLHMAGKKSDLGPTGINLSHTVRRLREERGYTFNELAQRLADIGRGIPVVGLRRIEDGTRRVDADDLMALAVALGISPITLLFPPSDSPQTKVVGTAIGEQSAGDLWSWLRATDPLPADRQLGQLFAGFADFAIRARPEWALETLVEELQERRRKHEAELARRGELRQRRRTQRSREQESADGND